LALSACGKSNKEEEDARDGAIKGDIETKVARKFADNMSVEYRNAFITRRGDSMMSLRVECGEVRGKDKNGDFSNWQRFVAKEIVGRRLII
jgi:major membrane immunogen (membrane-anchored lipoprotein)